MRETLTVKIRCSSGESDVGCLVKYVPGLLPSISARAAALMNNIFKHMFACKFLKHIVVQPLAKHVV